MPSQDMASIWANYTISRLHREGETAIRDDSEPTRRRTQTTDCRSVPLLAGNNMLEALGASNDNLSTRNTSLSWSMVRRNKGTVLNSVLSYTPFSSSSLTSHHPNPEETDSTPFPPYRTYSFARIAQDKMRSERFLLWNIMKEAARFTASAMINKTTPMRNKTW